MLAVGIQRLLKFAQKFALFFGELDRRFYNNLTQQISDPSTAHLSNALATQAKDLAGLRFVRAL